MLADASVVCWPTRRECVGGVSTDALADVLADALVGSDSLLLPTSSQGCKVEIFSSQQNSPTIAGGPQRHQRFLALRCPSLTSLRTFYWH